MGLVTRWKLAKVALSCDVALDMLCQEMHEAWSLGDATERPFVTAKARDVVRENRDNGV